APNAKPLTLTEQVAAAVATWSEAHSNARRPEMEENLIWTHPRRIEAQW
ncbi:MAG: hypothetical protein RL328_2847, partial [Acidobacteriota bacterium]